MGKHHVEAICRMGTSVSLMSQEERKVKEMVELSRHRRWWSNCACCGKGMLSLLGLQGPCSGNVEPFNRCILRE